jgi:hypothetical protein
VQIEKSSNGMGRRLPQPRAAHHGVGILLPLVAFNHGYSIQWQKDPDTFHRYPYSCRKASIGSSFAARIAG